MPFPNYQDQAFDLDINIFQTLDLKANAFLDIHKYKKNNIEYLEASLETILIAIELFESIMSSFKDEKTKLFVKWLNCVIFSHFDSGSQANPSSNP